MSHYDVEDNIIIKNYCVRHICYVDFATDFEVSFNFITTQYDHKMQCQASLETEVKPNLRCHGKIAINVPYISILASSWYSTNDGVTAS